MTAARRPLRRGGLAAALLAVGATGTALALVPQDPRDDEPPARAVARALETSDRDVATDAQPRWLTTPRTSFLAPVGWVPIVADREAARRQTLVRRADRRAYDGAPPVMPHSRNFGQLKACLDCHATGIRLGDRFGPPVSHPHLAACEQCHVESANLDLGPPEPAITSRFVGLAAPRGGTRAGPYAPPVVPHSPLMRTDCLACHGPESYPGLRTDHPQRRNCVQCHALSAALDPTSPFFTGRPTLVRPDHLPGASPVGP
ncbi:MAG: multiheme c-type cytochrome [Planctomycetota bacterium]